jgi:hypothetical protein
VWFSGNFAPIGKKSDDSLKGLLNIALTKTIIINLIIKEIDIGCCDSSITRIKKKEASNYSVCLFRFWF